MTKFEIEMRDFLSKDTLLENKVFADKVVIGELSKDTVVKISFETTGYADHYYGLMLRIINKKNGVLDTQFFKFSNIINESNQDNNYYIWTNRGESDWYNCKPTKLQKTKFMNIMYDYIKLYM